MSLFSSLGKSISKGFKSFGSSFASNPIGSVLGMSGLPQSSSQWIPGGEFLQSGFSGIGDQISGLYDIYSGRDIALKNYKEQQRQFDLQQNLNERQFQYQKELNQLQNQREDTAYQRKVADLKAAGLNPILGASGSGSSTTLGVSPALRAAPAPQMADTSHAGREGLSMLSNLVLNMISMRKDFAMKDAQIKLFQAEKDKVDAEAAGIRTENEFKPEYLSARNENIDLDNQFKSGTLQTRIDMESSKLTISKKQELVKNMELMLGQADYNLKKIDYEIQKLVKEGKITENQILDKKLELLTIECLQKSLDYSNTLWDTDYYHGMGIPVGFNSSWIGQLVQFMGNLFWRDKEDTAAYFSGVTGRNVSVRLKNDVKRPVSKNRTWSDIMFATHDYGAKRNVF